MTNDFHNTDLSFDMRQLFEDDPSLMAVLDEISQEEAQAAGSVPSVRTPAVSPPAMRTIPTPLVAPTVQPEFSEITDEELQRFFYLDMDSDLTGMLDGSIDPLLEMDLLYPAPEAIPLKPAAVKNKKKSQNVSVFPQSVPAHPQNVSAFPQNVPEHPQNISAFPQNVSVFPQNVPEHPQGVPAYLQNVSALPQSETEYPQSVPVPQNVPEHPQNVSAFPQSVPLPQDVPVPQSASAKPKSKTKKVVSIVFNVFFWCLIVAIIGSAAMFALSHNTQKSYFGYRLYSVKTPSMTPTAGETHPGTQAGFYEGDMILVKLVDPSTIKVGDIITYIPGTNPNTYLSHRVVQVLDQLNDDPGLYFITKGDANPSNDPPVAAKVVVGKVVFSVRGVGAVLEFIQENLILSLICVVSLFGFVIMLRYYFSDPAKAKKQPPASPASSV